jgi:outer membrane lipase/esterase
VRAFGRILLATAIVISLAASGAASAQFSNAYFFGDSLTDMGTYKPFLPSGTGLFTTNPGPVWAQPFAQHWGFSATPANEGGTDYAQGGARVTQQPGYPPVFPTGSAVPIATQISQVLAKGPVDSGAIYAVWGGGNDIFAQLANYAAGQINQTQLQANVAVAAGELAQQVARLEAAGARYVIIWNMPDIGATPFGLGSGAAPLLTGVSDLFNGSLTAGLNATGVHAIRLNVYGLYRETNASPATYGLQNVTASACGDTTPSLLCTSANFVTPNAPQTYLWATDVHPTTAGHAILAQYAESVIEAPQQMAALAEAPLAVEQANWRTLDGRMVSAINGPRTTSKPEAWAAYDYSAPDYSSSFFNGNGDVNTIAVGGDMKLSDRLLVGLMFNYSENKSDYGGMGFRLRQPMGTLYAGYGDGPWYLGATLGGGSLDLDTTRNIALGAATRTETGTTSGWQFVGRLVGGYWFKAGDWIHGPTVKLTYQEIRVRQFSENGSSSTTMTFGQQERTSFVTSAGWQVAGQLGAVRPFARASWEYEGQADSRDVTASIYGGGGSFSIPAYRPDDSWGLFNFGVATDFGTVTGYLTGSATAGKGDGDYYAVTVGVRVPL